jgi:pyruvate,orthophosphate dikinase
MLRLQHIDVASATYILVAVEVFKEKEHKVDYMVGTMIELPRAALVAD